LTAKINLSKNIDFIRVLAIELSCESMDQMPKIIKINFKKIVVQIQTNSHI